LLPGFLLFGLTIFPFLFLDPGAFIEDTFLYGSGGLKTSYPIQGFHGYGFATVLLYFKIIPDGNAHFPFIYLQILICFPLLIFFVKTILRQPTLSAAVLLPGLLLGIFMFFSRYLHGNFLGFILFWPVMAYCLAVDTNETAAETDGENG